METVTIAGEKRTSGGRHANARLRRRGLLPAVIYGHGEPPETVAVSAHDVQQALSHAAHVVSLRIDGQEQRYLVKDVQYDHLAKEPQHLDLMRVDETERVHVKVPLEFRGTPAGTQEGGTFLQMHAQLEIECLVLEIPASLRVRVDHLKLDEALHVKDIELPPNMQALQPPDEIIAIVQSPRGTEAEAVAEVAVEGSAEPEVIGRGLKEKEEGEAGA